MKLPCEIIVWYVLPKIRSELAIKLSESDISQKEISEKLGITQAAVSQYINKKRGHKMEFGQDALDAIKRLADDIIKDDADLILRTCDICGILKKDRTICGLHKKYDLVPLDCNACFGSSDP